MSYFNSTPAPLHTLWNAPQTTEQRLPGIWSVTTASHGGFVLSDERQAAMPEPLRVDGNSYEEDVNWSLVILGFEDEFGALCDPLFDIERDLAHQTARHWLPHRYSAFTGRILEPSESHVLKKIALYEAAIGEIGVRSAAGDWAGWVPKGMVGEAANVSWAVTILALRPMRGRTSRGCAMPPFTTADARSIPSQRLALS